MAAEPTIDPVRMPPGPRMPKALQGLGFIVARRRMFGSFAARYGRIFTVTSPIIGEAVVVSDPVLVKELFTADTNLFQRAGTLGEVFGPGSTFSLDGEEHRKRRKLLVPPFHGKRMQGYASIIEEEVLREAADWPQGEEFPTLPSMMRITVKAILRAVFGAEGPVLDELADILPRGVALGARLAVLPPIARRDFGPWSPWGRAQQVRRRYDEIVADLIRAALDDPDLDERGDVLSLMLRARYDDGTAIAHDHVADELLTLLAAGHETTATTLAWTIERIRRNPDLLRRLSEDADAGDDALRQATIWEVQRFRPVVAATARLTRERIRLGPWVLPANTNVIISIGLSHADDANFSNPQRFDPDRFADAKPDTNVWIPFGGGVRRCIGAAFANMEMDVTLRTILTHFDIIPTDEPGEKIRSRGIATAPAKGGLVALTRRAISSSGTAQVSVAASESAGGRL